MAVVATHSNKQAGSLLLSVKRPAGSHRTAIVAIIGNFHVGLVIGLLQMLLS